MPSIALLPAVHRFLRQALRKLRLSVPASTPFIGPGQNNFSHQRKESSRPSLSHSDSSCAEPAHKLCQDDSNAVSMRSSQCPDALHEFVSIRCSGDSAPAPETRLETQINRADCRSSTVTALQKNGGKRIAPCRHRCRHQPYLLSACKPVFNPVYCWASAPSSIASASAIPLSSAWLCGPGTTGAAPSGAVGAPGGGGWPWRNWLRGPWPPGP